jgi:hypothetical protein
MDEWVQHLARRYTTSDFLWITLLKCELDTSDPPSELRVRNAISLVSYRLLHIAALPALQPGSLCRCCHALTASVRCITCCSQQCNALPP